MSVCVYICTCIEAFCYTHAHTHMICRTHTLDSHMQAHHCSVMHFVIYMHICVYIYVHTYVCTYVQCIYVHTIHTLHHRSVMHFVIYMYICVYIYVHTYVHTYIHILRHFVALCLFVSMIYFHTILWLWFVFVLFSCDLFAFDMEVSDGKHDDNLFILHIIWVYFISFSYDIYFHTILKFICIWYAGIWWQTWSQENRLLFCISCEMNFFYFHMKIYFHMICRYLTTNMIRARPSGVFVFFHMIFIFIWYENLFSYDMKIYFDMQVSDGQHDPRST